MKRSIFKKTVVIVLGLVLILSNFAIAGCGDGGVKIDPNRTQLHIGVKDDGYGRDWLDAIIKEYETLNPDVQVIPTLKNKEYDSANLLANIKFDVNDLYLAPIYYYDAVNMNGTSEFIEDISDIVMEGGEDSIWNRWDDSKDFFNVGTDDSPKVFALSTIKGFWGAIYDKDMFAEYELYNLDAYKGLDLIDGNEDDCYGPDGVEGTYDDGMPATFEDFKELLVDMVSKNITPFTWTGMYQTYRSQFLKTIIASYEGLNDFKLRDSFDGTDSQFGKIDNTNAYLLAGQDGARAAVTFAKEIAGNDQYFSKNAFNTTQSHLQAQLEFIKSVKTKKGSPIGFLIEGGWWETEAKPTFAEMKNKYGEGYGYGERNFGILPLPKFIGTEGVPDQTNTRSVITGGNNTYSHLLFVNKNSTQKALAKDFIKFLVSREMCAKFTEMTGCIRTFDYTLTDDQLANMTSYGREIWNLVRNPDVDKIDGGSKNYLQMNAPGFFYNWNSYCALDAEIDSSRYDEPMQAFFTNNTITVQQYMDGIANKYNHDIWYDRLGMLLN